MAYKAKLFTSQPLMEKVCWPLVYVSARQCYGLCSLDCAESDGCKPLSVPFGQNHL